MGFGLKNAHGTNEFALALLLVLASIKEASGSEEDLLRYVIYQAALKLKELFPLFRSLGNIRHHSPEVI